MALSANNNSYSSSSSVHRYFWCLVATVLHYITVPFILLAFIPLFISQSHADILPYGGATAGITKNGIVNAVDKGTVDYDSASYKIYGGLPLGLLLPAIPFSSLFSLEGYYTDFSTLNIKKNTQGQTINITANSESYGLGFVVEAPIPILTPYGRLGLQKWVMDSNLDLNSPWLKIKKDSGYDFFYGAGVALTIFPFVKIGLEYERYNFGADNETVDFISTLIRFGS